MIYITGDTHGNFRRLNTENFPEQKEMTKDDYVIICGDFGGVWNYKGEDKEEKYWLDWLEDKPFTTLFVDGNHENFDRLYSYPLKEWNGGNIHEIRPSVLHLMRGNVFNIDGRSIFTFGGAASHDIQDGILDPNDFVDEQDFRHTYRKWNKKNKMFRVKGISWWEEEMPTTGQIFKGLRSLSANDWKVDFIVTHCCSSSTQALFSQGLYKPDELTDYLEEIRTKTDFKKWFFGHYHDNRNVNDKEIMLYEQIIRIN